MIHSASPTSNDHLKFVLFCRISKSGNKSTNPTCENSDHYWPRGSIQNDENQVPFKPFHLLFFIAAPSCNYIA